MATSDITTSTPAIEHEEWRDIPGYEGLYQVSNLGRVRSLPRNGNYGRRYIDGARRFTVTNGYHCLNLVKDGKPTFIGIHRLVMWAFVGAQEPGQDVNHIDGDKANNSLANLEYCTRGENLKHAHKLGLRNAKGENNTRAKLTDDDVREIRRLVKQGMPKAQIARHLNASPSQVGNVANGRTWSHIVDEDG